MRVRSNVNAQGYHSNHYALKLPRNIEKLVFHCSASNASLVQISHSTVRPELSMPWPTLRASRKFVDFQCTFAIFPKICLEYRVVQKNWNPFLFGPFRSQF